jgi:beta-galactosidase
VLTVDRRPKRSYFACRTAHAPVASMTLGRTGRSFVVTLTPRDENDLPAYVMREYRLLWRGLDHSGGVIQGGLIDVPVLTPGDAAVQLRIKPALGLASLLVDLIDPLGYSLLTAKSDLAPPSAPSIRKIHASSQKLRVTFDAVARADEYVALVRSEEGERRTEPTIDTFIELADLKLGKTYDIRLVATNGAGESPPGSARQATTSQEDLPPVLWSIQAADRALFLNYSTEAIDYLYDVEVTPEATGVARMISVDQPGVTRIPHLENGARYRVRMRRRNGLGNISGWTEPQLGVPRGPRGLPAPLAAHLVPGADGAMLLLFEPVENAAGYEVRSGSRTVIIDAAVSGSAFLRGFRPRGPVTLRAVDDFGLGGAAAEVSRLPAGG